MNKDPGMDVQPRWRPFCPDGSQAAASDSFVREREYREALGKAEKPPLTFSCLGNFV